MATATAPQHPNGQPPGSPAPPPPLWGGKRIPIILLSGEINSGKSIFPILIDPVSKDLTHEPNVCVWDQEGSVEPYVGGLNFEWKDTRAAIMEGYHMQTRQPDAHDPKWRRIILTKADANDFPSTALFRAWYMSLLATPRGKYRVGSVDTFTPIQEGLIEWLKTHPEAFGRTAAQYDKASSMFLWPDVKAVLSHILAVDCRLRFETFCMTVHLKNEWKSGAKTGIRIAEGLDVLDKLATLHLQLDRTAKSKSKSAPRLPSAVVKKQRLVEFGEDEDRPILPPRLPEATPNAIRAYIASPPDFANLKPDERMPDDAMSDDDKLRLQAVISENNRITAETESSRLEKIAAAARSQTATQQYPPGAATQPSQAGPAPDQPATTQQVTDLMGLITESFADEAAARATVPGLLAKLGIGRIAELNYSQAEQFRADLLALKSAELLRRANAKLASGPTPTDPIPQPIHEAVAHAIREELPSAFATPEECQARFGKMLSDFGCQRIAELTDQQGEVVLAALRKLAESRRTAQATGQDQAGATHEQLKALKTACEAHGFDHEQQTKWLTARGLGSFRSATVAQLNELLTDLNETPF